MICEKSWLVKLIRRKGFPFAKRDWDKRRRVQTTIKKNGKVTGVLDELKRSGESTQ